MNSHQLALLQLCLRAESASFPKAGPEESLLWAPEKGVVRLRALLPLTDCNISIPSCVPFSIYTPWGDRCEYLSMKLSAAFGIFFGTLGALLLLGTVVFVVLRFWSYRTQSSYPLDSES